MTATVIDLVPIATDTSPLANVLEQLASPRDAWACQIRARWNMAVSDIIATGQLLIDAKAELPHGEFEAMVVEDLGWSPRTAQRLMAVATHPVLANATHVSLLPAAWGTLAELARLEPEVLTAAIERGDVRPDMKRAEVARLLRPAEPEPDAGDPEYDAGHDQEGDLLDRARRLARHLKELRRDCKARVSRDSNSGLDNELRLAVTHLGRALAKLPGGAR